jgi:DNA polymerase III subunit delta'
VTVWNWVVGQDRAIDKLRQLAEHRVHAYLFVGPDGCGKEEAAKAFATVLLAESDDSTTRDARLISQGSHPSVIEVLREGAAVDKEEADNVIRLAATTPTEGRLKIVVIHEVHLMRDSAAVRLLKTIEEPAERIVFILLADHLVPSLATINSRCVVVNFSALPDGIVADTLTTEGVEPSTAHTVASMASGNLTRARLLAHDPKAITRQEAFASVPRRLDGTGNAVTTIVDELFGHIDDATAPLVAQHERELAQLEERVAMTGERGSGRKALQDRHKRQLRKFKTDELRSGLATIASTYRDALVDGHPDDERVAAAIHRIHKTMSSLGLNANEELAVQALLLQCPSLMSMRQISAVQ